MLHSVVLNQSARKHTNSYFRNYAHMVLIFVNSSGMGNVRANDVM